jgi:hypothetical protein
MAASLDTRQRFTTLRRAVRLPRLLRLSEWAERRRGARQQCQRQQQRTR